MQKRITNEGFMGKLEKSIYISNLFNFYKNLFKDYQQKVFKNYYFNDLGLTEIAKNLDISRQAVLDSIRKTEKKLLDYEDKLNFYKAFSKQEKLIDKIKQTKDLSKLDKLLEFWED